MCISACPGCGLTPLHGARPSCFARVPVGACGQSSPVSPRPPHRGLAAARHWPLCAGLPVCPPRGRPRSGAKTRRLAAADIVGLLGYRRRNRGTKRGTTACSWFVDSFEINCLRHLVESVNRDIWRPWVPADSSGRRYAEVKRELRSCLHRLFPSKYPVQDIKELAESSLGTTHYPCQFSQAFDFRVISRI